MYVSISYAALHVLAGQEHLRAAGLFVYPRLLSPRIFHDLMHSDDGPSSLLCLSQDPVYVAAVSHCLDSEMNQLDIVIAAVFGALHVQSGHRSAIWTLQYKFVHMRTCAQACGCIDAKTLL